MNDPFVSSSSQRSRTSHLAASLLSSANAERSDNGLGSTLNTQASFPDFYRKIAAEVSSSDFSQKFVENSVNNLGFQARQSSSSYELLNQFANSIYRPSATAPTNSLDLLRQDLEQSYQNSEYLLSNARDSRTDISGNAYHTAALDRSAEMQERQRQEQELGRDEQSLAEDGEAYERERTKAEEALEKGLGQQVRDLRKQELRSREPVAEGKKPAAPSILGNKLAEEEQEAASSVKRVKLGKEVEPLAKSDREDRITHKEAFAIVRPTVNDSEKNADDRAAEASPAKGKNVLQVRLGAGDATEQNVASLNSEAAPHAKGNEQEHTASFKQGEIEPFDQKEVRDHGKQKIQVIDERTAKQVRASELNITVTDRRGKESAEEQVQASSHNVAKTVENSAEATATRSQFVGQSALLAERADKGKNDKAQVTGKHHLEKLGESQAGASDSETKVELLGKQNKQNTSTAESLGRVAELRKQQLEGIQYTSHSARQDGRMAVADGEGHAQGKAQAKASFEFVRKFSETSSGSDSATFHLQTQNSLTGKGIASTQSVLLRSFGQQIAERLQEGPLAQNLRQLQFRLLDQNRGEIRLRLNPKNLGQLRIHLNIDGSQLSGRIVADSAAAARILQENMQHLESSLREGGFENQGLNVSVGGGQAGHADSGQPESGRAGTDRESKRMLAEGESWEDLGTSEPYVQWEQSQINYSA